MNLKKLTRMTVLVAMALVSSCVGKTLPSEAPASSALTPTALTPIALTEIKPANRSEAPAPSASTLSEIKRIKDIHPAKRSKAQMKKLRELSNIPKPEQVLAGRSPGGVQRVARAQLQKFYAEKAALKAANSLATDMPESSYNRTPAEPAQPSLAAAALQDTTGTGLVEIKAGDPKADTPPSLAPLAKSQADPALSAAEATPSSMIEHEERTAEKPSWDLLVQKLVDAANGEPPSSVSTRMVALRSIGGLAQAGNEKAIQALLALVNDPKAYGFFAQSALASLAGAAGEGNEGALQALNNALGGNEPMRNKALEILGGLLEKGKAWYNEKDWSRHKAKKENENGAARV